MKKVLCFLLFCLLLFCCASPCFAADEIDAARYAAELRDALEETLDRETRALLDELSPDLLSPDGVELSWHALVSQFGKTLQESLRETLRPFTVLLVLVLLFAFASVLVGAQNAFALELLTLSLLFLQCVSVLTPLLSSGAVLLRTSATFMKAFLPIYAGLVAFSGAPAAALGVQSLVFGLCEGLSGVSELLCVHGIGAFVGLCGACCLSEHVRMGKFLAGVNKAMSWLLGLLCAIFTGVLGAKSVLSAAADSAAGKSVRFLLSSAIPVVGAAISDAYSSVLASIHLIKGSVAVVGVLALLSLHLPPLVQSLTALCAFKTLGAAAESLGLSRSGALFQGFSLALKFLLLLGVLELFLLLIAIGLLLQMKGGG